MNNLSGLDIKQIIVIEAKPILSIREDLNYNLHLAAISVYTSSPVIFVANNTGGVERAAEKIYYLVA